MPGATEGPAGPGQLVGRQGSERGRHGGAARCKTRKRGGGLRLKSLGDLRKEAEVAEAADHRPAAIDQLIGRETLERLLCDETHLRSEDRRITVAGLLARRNRPYAEHHVQPPASNLEEIGGETRKTSARPLNGGRTRYREKLLVRGNRHH